MELDVNKLFCSFWDYPAWVSLVSLDGVLLTTGVKTTTWSLLPVLVHFDFVAGIYDFKY